MVHIHLKDTGIDITCETSEELHTLYSDLGTRYIFIIEGIEIKKMGPTSPGSYFAGYTKDYFKKNFFGDKK